MSKVASDAHTNGRMNCGDCLCRNLSEIRRGPKRNEEHGMFRLLHKANAFNTERGRQRLERLAYVLTPTMYVTYNSSFSWFSTPIAYFQVIFRGPPRSLSPRCRLI